MYHRLGDLLESLQKANAAEPKGSVHRSLISALSDCRQLQHGIIHFQANQMPGQCAIVCQNPTSPKKTSDLSAKNTVIFNREMRSRPVIALIGCMGTFPEEIDR